MRCFTVLGPSQTGKSTVVEKLGSLEGAPTKIHFPLWIEPDGIRFRKRSVVRAGCAGRGRSAGACAACAAWPATPASCAFRQLPEEAVLAAPYLRVIEASGTPCILFVNRMDEPRGRLRDVIAALQDYASHTLLLRQIPIREDDRIVGSCDLISERAWRYREGQPSALIAIPERYRRARTRGAHRTPGAPVRIRRLASRGTHRRPRTAQRRALRYLLAGSQGKQDHPGPDRRGKSWQRHDAADEGTAPRGAAGRALRDRLAGAGNADRRKA